MASEGKRHCECCDCEVTCRHYNDASCPGLPVSLEAALGQARERGIVVKLQAYRLTRVSWWYADDDMDEQGNETMPLEQVAAWIAALPSRKEGE